MSGELAAERWSPAQRVESVLLSIISLLDDGETSSPANVDAGVLLRKDPKAYRERVKEDVELSKKDIPEGFVMPTHESTARKPEKEVEDPDFWVDSEEDDGFGGSDTDEGMEGEEEDEEQESEGEEEEDDEMFEEEGSEGDEEEDGEEMEH
ncbi:MAG: hypothetical protein Q9201_007579 [Fulgogasparrea decipioides]